METIFADMLRDLNGFLESQVRKPVNEDVKILYEAMAYSLLNGGKRIRGLLTMSACQTFCGSYKRALPTASAIEMIHCWSLIHDDLPCVDNDDFRRGKPSLHKVYGDAMALFAGDSLLVGGFNVLIEGNRAFGLEHELIVDLVKEVSLAVGPLGLLGGQAMDMEYQGKVVDFDTLSSIHHYKTGALLRASVYTGAMIGGANPEALEGISKFGTYLGIAFQIVDDILDVIGDKEKMGKSVRKDNRDKKNTYPAYLGIEKSIEEAERLYNMALVELENMGIKSSLLHSLATAVIYRDR
ncbi:polyprenyl synthetase family protein [Carboxydocella sp. ULO1]|uniref:polyprenyl synthetase family protein n=1 Tax=Carboxydocella sp. ULO1 TaxID=1926599 RepID=UPI0009AD04B7|nr:farnesyl diphosphate synthase [Carboxydocella sp. ULO1]GAW28630.1 farnesyl-diphosphate synthase [Carboxydocella sp. ULO1]